MKSRRITILAHGTRGDVEPLAALGLELERRGHTVRLAAPGAFGDFIRAHGLEAASLRCSMDRMLASRRLWKYYRFGFFSRWSYIHDIQNGIGARAFEDAKAACEGAEAIVFHPMMPFATDIAEAMDVPCILAAFQPLTETAEFPLFSVTTARQAGWLNRLSYRLTRGPYAWYRRRLNRARKRLLGLRRRPTFADPLTVRGARLPAVYGISQAVVAQPPDWGPQSRITGYWFLEGDGRWVPPDDLVGFLAAGEKPIYIGFGSNPVHAKHDLPALVSEALRREGQRAILWLNQPPGRSDIGHVDPKVIHVTAAVPHRWIFERVAAAVHHGGAGTVAASLRAGLPTLVCPLLIDQFWWAERVHAIGAGPAPLAFHKLTADNLASRLRDLTGNPAYAQAAARIAAQIAGEKGATAAADVIEEHLKTFASY